MRRTSSESRGHAGARSVYRSQDLTFAFDRVFGPSATQREVYENTTRSLVDFVLDGFNATVFAYGVWRRRHAHADNPAVPNGGADLAAARPRARARLRIVPGRRRRGPGKRTPCLATLAKLA